MSSLFGCLTTLVPVVDITITRANDQIQGVHMFRSEGEMESIIAGIVAFKHLRLQDLLIIQLDAIFDLIVLSTAYLYLSPICDPSWHNW